MYKSPFCNTGFSFTKNIIQYIGLDHTGFSVGEKGGDNIFDHPKRLCRELWDLYVCRGIGRFLVGKVGGSNPLKVNTLKDKCARKDIQFPRIAQE